MKEATGELSTTVIAIVAIAAILAVFTVFLLPTLRAQISLTQACSNGPSYSIENNDGSKISCGDGTDTWTCEYTSGDGQKSTKNCTR